MGSEMCIRDSNRTVGTILSSEVTRRHGAAGLPDGTIRIHFRGSAGQSLMAFGVPGVEVTVEGDVNDYCGKGLSGGRVIVPTVRLMLRIGSSSRTGSFRSRAGLQSPTSVVMSSDSAMP